MSITEFLSKWSQEDPEKDYEFQDDFRSVLDAIPGQHSLTALKVLTDIEGAELVLDTEEDYGRIHFGKKGESIERGITVTYSQSYGQDEQDWLLLLKCIALHALNDVK